MLQPRNLLKRGVDLEIYEIHRSVVFKNHPAKRKSFHHVFEQRAMAYLAFVGDFLRILLPCDVLDNHKRGLASLKRKGM